MSDPSEPKTWWQSKTVWLNALLTVIGAASFFAEPKNDPVLTVPSISAAVVGVGNIALRVWFTAAPIAGTRLAFRVLAAQANRVGRAVAQTKAGGPA